MAKTILTRLTALRLACSGLLLIPALAAMPALAQEVEEIVIQGEFVPDEKLETSAVSEILDAEDMSVAGDSNVGDALKRLPGLSLIDGKFVFVRGLGDRYSSTYFNGTPVPSPLPLKRAVPLDMFDASVTRNVLVQKTYSAEFGAEFSGGVVDIRSTGIPSENYFKLGFSAGHNGISTNKDGFTYTGGDDDYWGFDDGTRDLPNIIQENIGFYSGLNDQGIQLFANPCFVPEECPTGGDIAFQDAARLSFGAAEWTARRRQNPVDSGFSFGFGRLWNVGPVDIGINIVGAHSNKWRNQLIERTRWQNQAFDVAETGGAISEEEAQQRRAAALEFTTDGSDPLDNNNVRGVTDNDRTINTIDTNLLGTIGVVIDGDHSINLTKMLARKVTDEASVRDFRVQGICTSQPDKCLLTDTRLQWTENELDFNQLSGEHIFDYLDFNWRYSIIDAARDAPDTRRHTLFRDNQAAGGLTRFIPGATALTRQAARTERVPNRSWSTLDDRTTEWGADLTLYVLDEAVDSMELSAGFAILEKEREFRSFNFRYPLDKLFQSGSFPGEVHPNGFMPIDDLLDPGGCEVLETPVDGDDCFIATTLGTRTVPIGRADEIGLTDGLSEANRLEVYDGTLDLEAYYLATDIQINEFWRFDVGFRTERSSQQVLDPRTGELLEDPSLPADVIARPENRDQYTLPAGSITWYFYPNMQLRAAYSKSVNRPILRELATIQIFNPDDGRQYRGNAELDTAEVSSRDLRYEWYFGENDYLSLSYFTKNIDDPIEQFQTNIGEVDVFTWRNGTKVENEGWEFEIRKYFGPKWLVTANATKINSRVDSRGDDQFSPNEFNEESNVFAQLEGRPLTGLSDRIYNAQVVYQGDSLTASLAWNRFSERIDTVLDESKQSEETLTNFKNRVLIYEQPRNSLDFNLKYKWFPNETDDITVGFKVRNILEEDIEFRHGNGLPFDRWETGRTFSLSFSWSHF